MDTQDIKTVELIVNSQQASKKLDELNTKLENVNRLRKEALDKGDAQGLALYTKEAKRLERQIQQISTRANTLKKVLGNLDKATPAELRKTMKEINKELNSGTVKRGSQQWHVLTQALRECDKELLKIKREAKAAEESMLSFTDRIARFGQKWVGIITSVQTFMMAITGLKSSMQSAIQDYATMQEAESQVIKYTGLSRDALNELSEALKHLDTRTARERLLELAGDAGRLGIQSRDQILEFVEAADQINVALGEDLGEDAVKNIGKLAQLFGDQDRLGLKKAMLSTGSAINELAQNSSASEPYILEFTSRLAGASHQAGLTQSQVMGLASTLDQSMVGVEKGATAMQNVIVKLYREPQKLAQAAGLDVQKFTELLRTDANEALMQFLTALSQKGGLEDLAPLFGDMKMSGSGVVQVLSALAGNIQNVRLQQEIATKAFREATSVTAEFNVQNNTVQASLDKAKKAFHEVSVELGEELMPLYSHFTGFASTSMKATITLIRFVRSHTYALTSLVSIVAYLTLRTKAVTAAKAAWATVTSLLTIRTTAFNRAVIFANSSSSTLAFTTQRVKKEFLALNGVQKAAVVGTQLLKVVFYALTFQFKAASTAVKGLTAALAASPVGAFVAVAAVAVGVIMDMVSATNTENKALDEQKGKLDAVNQAKKKAAESTAQEIGQINRLVNMLHSNNVSLENKRLALQKLQSIVPGYIASLTEEGTVIGENTDAIKEYIKQLNNKALAEAYYEQIKDVDTRLAAARVKQSRKQVNVDAVNAEIDAHPEKYKTEVKSVTGPAGYKVEYEQDNDALMAKKNELRIQRQALREASEEVSNLEKEQKSLMKAIESDQAISDAMNALLLRDNTSDGGHSGADPNAPVRKNKQYYKDLVDSLQAQYDDMTVAERKSAQGIELARKIQENQAIVDGYNTGKSAANDAAGERAEEKERKERVRQQRLDLEEQLRLQQEQLRMRYAAGDSGIGDYRSYLDQQYQIEQEYLKKIVSLYEDTDHEKASVMDQQRESTRKHQEEINAWSLQDLDRQYNMEKSQLELSHLRNETSEQSHQAAMDQLALEHLEKRLRYMEQNGAKAEEIDKARNALQEESEKQRAAREKRYLENLRKMSEEYSRKTPMQQMEIELEMLDALHREKLLSEEEYLRMKRQLELKYTGNGGLQQQYERERGSAALEKARPSQQEGAAPRADTGATFGISALAVAAQRIKLQQSTYQKLRELRQSDLINQAEYDAAVRQMDAERFENFASMAQAAYSTVSSLMTAYTEYSQACTEAEVARIENKYKAEIDAAGANSAKGKKLEEKKQKEINALKKKELKKSTAIQISQAIASTAMNALLAYQDMLALGLPAGPVLAPVAAALAVAAGMMQVATIKKQADAQMAAYYSGGFTGGSHYRREAGVVHEGEFVANHEAVNNPNVLPILKLIDRAQRNNTVGSLTARDVSRAVSAPVQTAVAASQTAESPLLQVQQVTDARTSEAIEKLNEQLETGIHAICSIDGDNGVYRLLKQYEKMLSRK